MAMLEVTLLTIIVAVVSVLAVRGAIAIWEARTKENGDDTSTPTAERLAAAIEGDDLEDLTIEERILALATGLKNVKHRQSMIEGRVNRISPPATGTGKGNSEPPPEERPLSRADLYKQWRDRNAR